MFKIKIKRNLKFEKIKHGLSINKGTSGLNDEYTYSSSGYFTIKNLRVYEKEGFDPSHPENSEVLAKLPEEYSIECLNGSLTPR